VRIWWANVRRLAHIVRVVVHHLLAYALARRLPWLGIARLSGPERLRQAFEDLGGTFLKLGQMLALQPDILSLEVCNALFDLMDRVSPFPWEEVEVTLVAELGGGSGELFDAFERRPLATASIGQVHVAQLGGRRLAVKVQRPRVAEEFQGDIRLMRLGIRWIERLRIRRLRWLVEPISEFVAWTHEELDYRYEARYMERLGANAEDNAAERVPALVAALSTRRVLTVELLQGMTVLDYLRASAAGDELALARVRALGFAPDRFARNVIDNFLGDAFRHGIFHADLHPANLMILPGNVVGYIDFGITAVLGRFSRHQLVALTLAYTRGDVDGMCDHFFEISTVEPGSDPEGFRAALKRLAAGWFEPGDGGSPRLRKNFTLVMLDMLTLSRATGIMPERDVVKYIRSAIAIDGLITRFAPGFEVGRYLEVVCDRQLSAEVRRRMMSFDRLAGWSAAAGRLIEDGPLRAADLLRRLAAGDLRVSAAPLRSPRSAGERTAARRQAVQLGSAAFACAALVAAGGEGLQPGINLFTSEALLAVAALGLLLRVVVRRPV
jgi:ubiquinone biosynthesis protein